MSVGMSQKEAHILPGFWGLEVMVIVASPISIFSEFGYLCNYLDSLAYGVQELRPLAYTGLNI
jgi:hypothetical protein